jgi:diguanylate cyclase (GGDEF)-like protein
MPQLLLRFSTLRSRYIVLATVLGILVIASVWLAQRYVADAGQASIAATQARNDAVHLTHKIRTHVWNTEYTLQQYMLSPSAELRKTVVTTIDEAIQLSSDLRVLDWTREHLLQQKAQELKGDLQGLQEKMDQLMKVRLDADLMYPAMRIARGDLLGVATEYETVVALALNELQEEKSANKDLYFMFMAAQNAWTGMISAFRLYLLNRIGSLFEEGLVTQKHDVELQYELVTNQLAQLRQHADRLGFQAGISLEYMHALAQSWREKFEDIVAINETSEWRRDVSIIVNDIRPLTGRIQQQIGVIDARIEESTARDVNTQTATAGNIVYVIWLIGLLFLVFMVISYLVFERSMLRPVALVAEGLKSEATGGGVTDLPVTDTDETRNLVDAFLEMRKQVRSRQVALEHQALHDALTELPNRTFLRERMHQAILGAQGDYQSIALIMLDLNRFKEINDTLGHHTGDRLLQQVGSRLTRLIRQTDTVARLGGDEFAILLPNMQESKVLDMAAKIHQALEQVYEVDDHALYVGASLGVAIYPQHCSNPETMLQHADVAMYMAKRSNDGIAVYDIEKDQHSIGQLSLLSELRLALDSDGLDLHYQPKISLHDNAVVGVEALLRWNHPRWGKVRPDKIVPLAEQTGLIKPLTQWVLNKALRQCHTWRQNGLDLKISINLSVWDLHDSMLDVKIRDALNRWQIPPNWLQVEITESAMMADPARAREVLSRLDEMDVEISVDDYGTGFSSLAYLKQLPVDMLKIDKSFVMDMGLDENDAIIVRSTIDLAHNLGLKVIAEGVEDKDTYDLLTILGCDFIQGYYAKEPVAADVLEAWLKKTATSVA